MSWACDGYGENVGQCFHIVSEEQIFTDRNDSAQGAPVVLCKKCEAEARADGADLIAAQ